MNIASILKKAKKEHRQELSPRAKKAITTLVEKGGSISKAMRDAGYSPKTAHNPYKLTRGKGYIAVMEEAGLTDRYIAQRQKELSQSARIESRTFPAVTREYLITEDEEGNKLENPKKEHQYDHVSDKDIKKIIESVPGHELLYIQTGYNEKIAHFKAPESAVRSKQVELSLKVKGHFAPESHEIMDHRLSDEEKEVLDAVFGNNQEEE